MGGSWILTSSPTCMSGDAIHSYLHIIRIGKLRYALSQSIAQGLSSRKIEIYRQFLPVPTFPTPTAMLTAEILKLIREQTDQRSNPRHVKSMPEPYQTLVCGDINIMGTET